MLLGRTGFTATTGSSASSIDQAPLANPSSHVPTALGRESSTSEPPTAPAADASGRVDGALGVSRSVQAASRAAASSSKDSMRSRYIVTSVADLRGRDCQFRQLATISVLVVVRKQFPWCPCQLRPHLRKS